MYVSLVVLPPLGIWLLWRRNKYDITLRTTLSAVSLIWMIIFLILVFSRSNTTPDNTLSVNNSFMSQVPAVTATATATATAEPTAEPSTTPRVNNGSNGTTGDSSVTYVWGTNSGKYYHTLENCGGLTNASKMTLETATARGLLPCPDCAGGTSNTGTTGSTKTSGTTLYATSGGKWYHKDSHCQGMTNAFAVKASTAISYNKTACPTCAKVLNKVGKNNQAGNGGANGAGGNNTAANNNKATASTNVYIKLGAGTNNYYHVAAKCAATGMTGGQNVTLEYALSHNYTACPSCKPPSKIQS